MSFFRSVIVKEILIARGFLFFVVGGRNWSDVGSLKHPELLGIIIGSYNISVFLLDGFLMETCPIVNVTADVFPRQNMSGLLAINAMMWSERVSMLMAKKGIFYGFSFLLYFL